MIQYRIISVARKMWESVRFSFKMENTGWSKNTYKNKKCYSYTASERHTKIKSPESSF